MFSKNSENTKIIEFSVTENIQKIGIIKLTLENRDFLITWSNGKQNCIDFNIYFKSSSLSQNIKLLEKEVKKEVKNDKNIDNETFDNAFKDIEDQLIKRREEIFNLNQTKKPSESNSVNHEFNSTFLEDVSKIRERFKKSTDPYNEWRQEVKRKYENLKFLANTYFEDSWQLLQFCISVKSVQNIYGNNLPFVGFILYKPSSLKSTIIDLFQKYPSALYVDDLTKNSFLSHYSTNSEEELQNNDLIPKMKGKILLTSEIAPIINANDDDLRKILGIITRLIDGKGYQSHSGTHGHRSYHSMMFTWVGAGIEIPPKMWTLLSQLGFKIYFFRPTFKKMTVEDLKKIANDDQLPEKKQKLEEALLYYLKVFDAAPQTDGGIIILDEENGNPKIRWDKTKDEDSVMDCISNLANLLAALRGTVNTSYSKTRKSTRVNNNTNDNNKNDSNDNETHDNEFIQTEQIDYEIEPSVTEVAARAVIQLRNLALGNAISQGRNYLIKDDARFIIRVCFSTTRIYRAKILNLLIENNGELTTSQIVAGLDISRPHALQTMQEFGALKICEISQISSYGKSERKIKLNDEYSWFLTKEFKQIYKPTAIKSIALDLGRERSIICCNMNSQYLQIINKNILNNHNSGTCDIENNNCHTNKENFNYERDKKNNNNLIDDKNNLFQSTDKNRTKSNNELNSSSNESILCTNDTKDSLTDINTDDNKYLDDEYKIKENNSPLQVEKYFSRVTASHEENCHIESVQKVVNEIIGVIKIENGPISLGFALQLACQRSDIVRDFLRDEKKLTQRDSKKVRNLFVEINRHKNIKPIKRKPELVVKWIENEEKQEGTINN